MTKEQIQDFTLRVTSANKTEMIVILYDIGLSYLKDAISDIECADYAGVRTEIGRTRSTLRELMNSLDSSNEIGYNLLKLYIFCSGELTKAYLDYDKNALIHVSNVFKKLREAYAEISPLDKSGSVMDHTEKVYNGYTYNKNMQSENIYDKDASRGILA